MRLNFKKFQLVLLLIIIISCKKQVEHLDTKILVLGNSMTIHSPDGTLGWYGNWGMAASSKEKDYIHILESKLHTSVTPVNFVAWEANHRGFDLSALDSYLNKGPDIVIIRLGENIQDINGLATSLNKLIDHIVENVPDAKVLITGTFWPGPSVNRIFAQVAAQRNISFIHLAQLYNQENISVIGATVMSADGVPYKITNKDVANHPGDIGMQYIADEILLGLKSILNQTISK